MRHVFRWFAVLPSGRVPRTARMAASGFGWDAVCSCGFDTRTGGGVRSYVRRVAADHLLETGIVRVAWL